MFSSQDPDGLEPSGADAVLTRSFTDSSLPTVNDEVKRFYIAWILQRQRVWMIFLSES